MSDSRDAEHHCRFHFNPPAEVIISLFFCYGSLLLLKREGEIIWGKLCRFFSFPDSKPIWIFYILLKLATHLWVLTVFALFGSLGCTSHHRCHSRVDWACGNDTRWWGGRPRRCLRHRIGWNNWYGANKILDLLKHKQTFSLLKVINSHLDAGDIESMPFIEALGQFSYRVGKDIIYDVNPFFLFLFSFFSVYLHIDLKAKWLVFMNV